MSELNKQVIDLLYKHKSIQEIAKKLNISEKEVYINIKEIISLGKEIRPVFYYDSKVRYEQGKLEENNKEKIVLGPNDKTFRCLVVSDLHIGSANADIELMNYVYDYAVKNEINNILNCGDLIEGTYASGKKSIKSVEEQIETIIKKHPYDKNINVFAVLGNHDFHSYYYDNMDIGKIIHDERYDINSIGYGKGIIQLGKDNILMSHKIGKKHMPEIIEDYKVQLIGHGHEMKTKAYDMLKICIPTLSNVSTDFKSKVIPGFVDLRIELEKNHFEFLEAKHIIITNENVEASKSSCRLKTLYYNRKK